MHARSIPNGDAVPLLPTRSRDTRKMTGDDPDTAEPQALQEVGLRSTWGTVTERLSFVAASRGSNTFSVTTYDSVSQPITFTFSIAVDTNGPGGLDSLGDDYATACDASFLLEQFVFAGGVDNPNEVAFFDFFDSSGVFVDGFGIQFPQGGAFIWTITLGAPFQIPGSGRVVMTTDDGTVAVDSSGVWFSVDRVHVGANDPTSMIVDGVVTDLLGPDDPNILGFELRGSFGDPDAGSAVVLIAGDDAWVTGEDTAAFTFGNPPPGDQPGEEPIPADFFGPGSDPFEGVVEFGGASFITDPADPNGPLLGVTDTIVKRKECTLPLGIGQSDTIEIEIVALSLESTQPITVTFNGGQNPTQFDVRLCLSSESPQCPGSMTITRDDTFGGTFESDFPVIPKFTFDGPGGPFELDLGEGGVDCASPPLVLGNDVGDPNSWALIGEPNGPTRAEFGINSWPAGVRFNANCPGPDSAWDPAAPENRTTSGVSNFQGGLDTSGAFRGGQVKCRRTKEACKRFATNRKPGRHKNYLSSDADDNGNGIPDVCEVECCFMDGTCKTLDEEVCQDAGGTSGGLNTKCDPNTGACCLPDGTCVMNTTKKCCEQAPASGQYMGDGTTSCPVPPCTQPPPPPDWHATWRDEETPGEEDFSFLDFNAGGLAIPGDFFGPGSDPFTGTVPLRGQPVDPQAGDSSVCLQRPRDPELPDIGSSDTVPIEIVALSLVSADPITVTFNGGMNPEEWTLKVELSTGVGPTCSNDPTRPCNTNADCGACDPGGQPCVSDGECGTPDNCVPGTCDIPMFKEIGFCSNDPETLCFDDSECDSFCASSPTTLCITDSDCTIVGTCAFGTCGGGARGSARVAELDDWREGSGRQTPRDAGGAALIYFNDLPPNVFFKGGANVPVADDWIFDPPTTERQLTQISGVLLHSPPATAAFDVALRLRKFSATGPLIPGATCSASGLAPDTFWVFGCDFGPNSGIFLPADRVWTEVTLSTADAGWNIAEVPQVGTTENVIWVNGVSTPIPGHVAGLCGLIRAEAGGPPPPGSLTATRTGPNGGTFIAQFPLRPLLTFTSSDGIDVPFAAPTPLVFNISGDFVNTVDETLGLLIDPAANFVTGIRENPDGTQEVVPMTAATKEEPPSVVHVVCPPVPLPACAPNSDGTACVGTCPQPEEPCVPTKIKRTVTGDLKIVECDCLPPGECHVAIVEERVQCVGECPNPDEFCILVSETNIDGTIDFTCECLTESPACLPAAGANPQSCVGSCPDGECCIISKIVKTLAGTVDVAECECIAWQDADPCRVVAPGSVPQCAGTCPVATDVCNLDAKPETDAGGAPTGDVGFTCSCGAAPGGLTCPATQELPKWNAQGGGGGGVRNNNNCYNYSTNKQTNTFAQPGKKCGRKWQDLSTCQDVKNSAICDGLVFIGNPDAPAAIPACPPGSCLVFLVVGPNVDYHWYRQNGDMTWSHKPGDGEATDRDSGQPQPGNAITDPRTADRRFLGRSGRPVVGPGGVTGYTERCGFMCVTSSTDVMRGFDPPEEVEDSGGTIPPDAVRASVSFYSGREPPGWDFLTTAEVDSVRAKIDAAVARGAIPDPNWEGKLGFRGYRLEPGAAVPNFPGFVRVFREDIEVVSGDVSTFFNDVDGLGELLRARAIAEGFGDLVPKGSLAPTVAIAPHDRRKNRVISINPNNADPIVMRVELLDRVCSTSGAKCTNDEDCASGETCDQQSAPVMLGWVSDPITLGAASQMPPGATVARVVDAMPAFRVWSETIVHVSDCEIAPVQSYAISASTDGLIFSQAVRIGTIKKPEGKEWADYVSTVESGVFTPPNGILNVNDLSALLAFFQGRTVSDPEYVVTTLELAGEIPTFVISAADLSEWLRAFGGGAYPPPSFLLNPSDDPANCP